MPEESQTNKQLEALENVNDKLLQGLEDSRQNYEASQKVITESFQQIIEEKNTKISIMREKYDDLASTYNYLIQTRNKDNDISSQHIKTLKITINEQEQKIIELDSKLEKINNYLRSSLYDTQTVSSLDIILTNESNTITTKPLLENKEQSEKTQATKVPVKEIVIERLEGMGYECVTKTAKSFDEANEIIKEMSKSAPRDGTYDKVRFSVEFVDGEKYDNARIDMKHYSIKDNQREQNIPEHIHDHISFYTGKLKSDHMTQEQYDTHLSRYTSTETETMEQFLDRYIPDEAKNQKVIAYELSEAAETKSKTSEKVADKSTYEAKSVKTKEKDGGLGY
jgi:hypothetical protein